MFTKKSKILIYLAIALLSMPQIILAEVKLPAIVSSNMVLQRNTKVTIWGWADINEEITIKFSWIDKSKVIKADGQGNWRTETETTNSKAPQTISIKSKYSNILIENILFGEVWLCSGQSNMYQPVKGYTAQPTFGSSQAIIHSNNPKLRLFSVDRVGSEIPLQNLKEYSSWQPASPNNVANFSAVAYFFGEQLQKILDVPVGMIHTSWGGSKVEAWISNDMLSGFQEVNLEGVNLSKGTQNIPTVLYNAMIHPLIPYTIKGALWYQGESNRNNPEGYKSLFPAMVKDWRTRWGIGDFPFYFVQIAPFTYRDNEHDYQHPKNTAFMREAQLECLELIPNSGIAITLDIGSKQTIHPPKKKEVADRLLFNALNKTYGFKTVDFLAPHYESYVIDNSSIVVSFKNAEMGLFSFDELNNFEIAGKDKVFYPAKAKIIDSKKVLVSSDKVSEPLAVRYAWRNWVTGDLYGTNLLPVSSFRTDQWDDAKCDIND